MTEPVLHHLRTIPITKPDRARPDADCCELCFRKIDWRSQNVRYIRLVGGDSLVIHREDSGLYPGEAKDAGFNLVGPECARKLGVDFTWSTKSAA